jgi:hypothetical protein
LSKKHLNKIIMKRLFNILFAMFIFGSVYLMCTGQSTKMFKIYTFIILKIVLLVWYILSMFTSLIGLGDIPMPKFFWESLHSLDAYIADWASH